MYLNMISLVEGEWQRVAVITMIPCLIVILLNLFALDESSRLLLM